MNVFLYKGKQTFIYTTTYLTTMELTCNRKKRHCGYVWDYQGKNKFFACCPKCHKPIKIPYGVDEQ